MDTRWVTTAFLCFLLVCGVALSLDDVINSGDVSYTGGNPDYKNGADVRSYTNSGTVSATGGSGIGAHGINVFSGFTNSGTVSVTGGSGEGANGINVNANFTNSGIVRATGGSGDRAYGIYVVSNITNSGTVSAAGGSGDTAYGVHGPFSGSFTNSGLLVLAAGGGSDAITVSNPLVFSSGSTLALAGGSASVIQPVSSPGNAGLISLTATTLAPGGTHLHENFLTGNGGNTELSHPDATPTLRYFDYDTGGGLDHSVTVERVAHASSFAGGGGAAFLGGLEQGLRGMSEADLAGNLPYALILSRADHQATGADIAAFAARASRELSPQGTANLMAGLGRAGRMASTMLSDGIAATARMDDAVGVRSAASASAGSAYASLSGDCGRGVHMWLKPLFLHGRLDGEAGYSDLRENVGGGSLGAAWRRDRLTLGLSGHYLHADAGGSAYDARYNGYGANAGGAYRFEAGCLNPLVSLSAGYTRFAIDQGRSTGMEGQIMPGSPALSRYGSKPDADLYTASLSVSERFSFCGGEFTPVIGLDYAHTRLDGDAERGVGAIRWDLSSSHMNSWEGFVGATYARAVSERVSLSAKGQYRYEFGDTHGIVRARSAFGGPGEFRFLGQGTGRSSGVVGLGVHYRVTDRARFSVDYDLHLARRYHGHQVSASFVVGF
ncbi:MAG: autotransporter domain-containing protein [Planctomycetaceae bacterium]|nr:autotransporter domain-containing protein [Planctomycetaceae bacterium]